MNIYTIHISLRQLNKGYQFHNIDWPYALKNTFTQKVRKFSYVDVIGNGDMR